MRERKWLWVSSMALLLGAVLALLLFSSCQEVGTSVVQGPSGEATEEPEASFPLAKVRAVSFRTGDKDIYPDQQVWLTLHGGYASHDNNVIVTSGLNNIPVGTYAYLQGKDADEHGTKITGWSWKVISPHEVEIEVEGNTSQQPRFMAATEGKYEVTVTATKEDGTTASSELTIYAGSYIGAENCALCHSGSVMPDVVTGWRETGHATKFEDFFGSYGAERDYCVGCHTTGYNENDKAGGFDDAAQKAGWSPDKGSFMEWVTGEKLTLNDLKNTPVKQFMNIQCENCHGPGSVHTKALSFEPGVCSQCHPQEAAWRFSGHAATGSANMHMAESTDCIKCHTGQGFVEVKVRHNEPIFPDMATPEKPANLLAPGDQPPVACATCHDPHAFTEPKEGRYGPLSHQLRLSGEITMPNGVTVDAEESALCVSCHANKRDLVYKADFLAGKNSRGPHGNTQADNFYGITAAAFDYDQGDYGKSAHQSVVKDGCIQCHMSSNPAAPEGAVVDNNEVIVSHGETLLNTAGGHTWNMTGTYQGQEIENVGSCNTDGCHAGSPLTSFNRKAYGDYDGDGATEGIQDEIDGLIKLLEAQLPRDDKGNIPGSGFDKMKLSDAQLKAFWNYYLVKSDGSGGVHNTAYSVEVLQRTYKQLTGQDVPGATIR